MAGLGGWNNVAKIGGKNNTLGGTSGGTAQGYNNYVYQPTGGSGFDASALNAQMDYLKNIPTGLTPEQELAMRNRIRATDTAQSRGGYNRIRELMAAQGMSGSGAELSGISGMLRNQAATRQGALSDLGIANANMNLQNQFNRANLMGNIASGIASGTESGRQFDSGQAADMYKFGTSFDESTRQYNQQRNDYQQQLKDWLAKLNQGGSGSSYGGNNYYVNRSRSR